MINKKNNKIEKEDQIEYCVLCKNDTGYKKDDNIQNRQYYIEGSGQLCKQCYEKIYINKEKNK